MSLDAIRNATIALGLLALPACGPRADAPLVIATTWPESARVEVESAAGGRESIAWVVLEPDEPMLAALDGRGGVDLLLGGPAVRYAPMASKGRLEPIDPSDPAPWRLVHRPGPDPAVREGRKPVDPRDDPSSLDGARAILRSEGWAKGWETLIRRPPGADRPATSPECVALVRDSPNQHRSRKLLRAIEARLPIERPDDRAMAGATADDLLADLLGSALFGAEDERLDAETALRRFNRPEKAETAMAERPPWPPASILKLRADPGGWALVETLAEHLAPDPESRGWLLERWSGPRRMIDGEILDEIAGAADGKLAREPRFRAWLASEWLAWERQLYRRAARLARGYVPS